MSKNDDIMSHLIDDGRGGKNIKYNDMIATVLGAKAAELGMCRASFSAGGVVDGYHEQGVFTAAANKAISELSDTTLQKRMLAVKGIAEIFRSIVVSFTSDKKFIITTHYTPLGAEYMTAKTGKKHEIDTEYYREGSFNISETPIKGTNEYDCDVIVDGENIVCTLSAETGLVSIKNYVFEIIPTVIVDESKNATGGFNIAADEIIYNGKIMKNVRYGDKLMHKAEPCDPKYEDDKNESEEQRTMRQMLDLYVPENVNAHKENCLILLIHGGAWIGGNKEGYDAACKYYASLGYFAATINHTYVMRRYEDGKRVTMYDVLDEIDMAFTKIKQLSDENGWNIVKAATSGYSSGSHLSTLYAYALGHRKGAPIPVVFTFSMVGPMSFHIDCWDGPKMPIGPQIASVSINDNDLFFVPEDNAELKQILEDVTACKISRDDIDEYRFTKYDKKTFDEKIASISPLAYVKKGEGIPTVLAEAAQDYSLISRRHAERMEVALTEAGLDHKVIVFPNSDHMGAGNAECGNVYRKYQRLFFKKYFGF